MNRVVIIFLVITMTLFIAMTYGTTEAELLLEPKQVRVYSTLHNNYFLSELIIENNIVYMKMDDILHYTNYSCDYNYNDKVFTLIRGKKRIIIDYNDNTISYPPLLPATAPVSNRSIYDYIDDKIILNNKLWLPIYPTFSYLNTILEINHQEGSLWVYTAEQTLFDFMFDFSEVLKDERYSIYNMIYDDSSTWVEKNLYRSALGISILLDVVENAEFLSYSRDLINSYEDILGSLTLPGTDYVGDRTYFSKFYREILLQILGGSSNPALQLSLEEKTFKDSVSQTLTYSQNFEFYKNLSPLEQKKIEAGGNFLTLVGLLNTAAKVSGEYLAINDLHESSVRLYKDSIINRGKHDSSLRESMLYREANYIVEYFENPSTVECFHIMGTDLLDDVLTAKVPPFAAASLTVKGVTHFYDYSGMLPFLEGIPRDLKSKTIADSVYFEIQHGIRKIHGDFGRLVLINTTNIGKEQIDGLYATALLYLKIKLENSANVYGYYNVFVAEEYEKYFFTLREELYLDNPRLIEIFATAQDLLLLEEISDDEIWAGGETCTFVNVEVLRLRSGPGTDYAITDRLIYGTPLEVKGRESDWLFVDVYPDCVYRNNQGWVHGDYVESGFGPYPCHPSDDGITIGGKSIYFFMEASEVVSLIGEPLEIVLDDYQEFSIYEYHYPGVKLSFSNILFVMSQYSNEGSVGTNEYLLTDIKIDGYQVFGPRNIRVGDSFESVLGKFPDANNAIKVYNEDTRGQYRRILYGRDEIPPVGYIYYDNNQKPLSVWLNNYPESYLFIEFEDNKVSNTSLYLQVM